MEYPKYRIGPSSALYTHVAERPSQRIRLPKNVNHVPPPVRDTSQTAGDVRRGGDSGREPDWIVSEEAGLHPRRTADVHLWY